MRDQAKVTREVRNRRAAQRQGMVLLKSRLRDPRAIGYGTYMLVSATDGSVQYAKLPEGFGLTIEDVERVLTGDTPECEIRK